MSTGRLARRRQRRERRERVGGIVLVSLGVVVLVVAVLALVNRHGSNNTANRTVIVTGTPPHSSASVSPSGPSTPASSMSSRPSTPATSRGASTGSSSGSGSTALLPVVILNNTRLSGLGHRAASLLQAQGYTVTSVGNYRNNIVSTCVYFDPSTAGADQAASALQSKFSWIARTKPKFVGLPAGPVVLVLAADIP